MKHTNFWDEVEGYTQKVDWFLISACGGLALFGLGVLIALP